MRVLNKNQALAWAETMRIEFSKMSLPALQNRYQMILDDNGKSSETDWDRDALDVTKAVLEYEIAQRTAR